MTNDIDPTLIIAALSGEADESELRELEAWRAASPEHEREFRRLRRLWEAAEEWGLPNEEDPTVPSARSVIERAESRRGAATPIAPERSGSEEELASPAAGPTGRAGESPTFETESPGSPWLRRTAIGALAAGLVALGFGLGAFDGWLDDRFGPEAVVTGADEVATVTLEDETVVRLAPHSRLEFNRGGAEREVSLSGRAYFAVSEREEDPFVVRLPTGAVEVLGTRFDVRTEDREMQVTVVEGEVRMAAEGGAAHVRQNEMARARDREAPEVEHVDDVFQVIDWLGQFLAFESTPMDNVAEEFQRRFGMQVEILDAELAGRTVTGWFADQTPEEMILSICVAVDARCAIEGGTVRMQASESVVDATAD